MVAHRGAATVAPEHTIPAYESAAAAGADAVWLDVQESADEQLVVVHDVRLERTTSGRGLVREHTVRELKRLDAGRWFGWRFRGQRIQTLAEVLERFRDRTGFVVALRAGSDVYPGIEERALGLLHLYGATDRTVVVSFDHHALLRCRALDGDIGLGACVTGRLLAPEAMAPPGILTALCLDAERRPRARRDRLPGRGPRLLRGRRPRCRRGAPPRRLASHGPRHAVRLRLRGQALILTSRESSRRWRAETSGNQNQGLTPACASATRIAWRSRSGIGVSGGRTWAAGMRPRITRASFIRLCMSTKGGA